MHVGGASQVEYELSQRRGLLASVQLLLRHVVLRQKEKLDED